MRLGLGPGGRRADPRLERTQYLFAQAAKHQRSGRFAEAEREYLAVVAVEPRNVAALNNLARVQQALGKPADAVMNYRRALALAPNEPRLLANLGNALSEQGNDTEAIAAYQHALVQQPNMAEAHNNLGGLLQRAGDLPQAAGYYQRAIELNPKFADPYGNLARLYLARGEMRAALHCAREFLTLAPGQDAQRLLVRCLQGMRPQPDDVWLRPLVERALTQDWDRPAELADIAAELVCMNVPAPDDVEATLAALATDKLLAALLVATPVTNAGLEHILTTMRSRLLHQLDATPATSLTFISSLAQQCFLNEYVWVLTGAERAAVAALRTKRPFTQAGLAVLACYEPLHALPDATGILGQKWPAELRPLLQQQIGEPLTEARLRSAIPVLGEIDDSVSRSVRQQYEANPYPRWTRPAPAEPVPSIDHLLRAQFPATTFVPLGKMRGLEVLIAGCGTGRQPIEVARQFPGSRVLAIDLSLTSLAYAQRKAREVGVGNIEFAQADLLRLGDGNRGFDMIQATGVLHHLLHPMEGWRVLASTLRPRGVMQLGLYSELARQPVVHAREFIATHGFRAQPDDIRRCRQDLLGADDTTLQWVAASRDFYYLSGCRDLLFHVQESRLTLPQIGASLGELGLVFLGFELEPNIAAAYRMQNPHDKAMTDLAAWHEFERQHPQTFTGMYKFWVQKPG